MLPPNDLRSSRIHLGHDVILSCFPVRMHSFRAVVPFNDREPSTPPSPTPLLPQRQVCNNLSLAISMAGTAEAMSLGSKMGMDPKVTGVSQCDRLCFSPSASRTIGSTEKK